MEVEYGSVDPIDFPRIKVILYDSMGKEIPVPICGTCEKEMSPIIGKTVMGWCCFEHGTKIKETQNAKDIDGIRYRFDV